MSAEKLHQCEDVIGPLGSFLDSALSRLRELGIGIEDKEIDHVCYRCETVEEYLAVCKDLLTMGVRLIESMIGGRPISIIQLHQPILYKHFRIPCLEIPCPKKGRFYSRGLEHLEVALFSTSEKSGEGDVVADMHDKKKLHEFAGLYPHVTFDLRAADKEVNADISIDINEKTQIKFHNRSIREVVMYEKSSGKMVHPPETYFEENSSVIPPPHKQTELDHIAANRKTSSCTCGALKAHCTGPPVRCAICHCFACQQRTGSVFGVQARFLADQVRIEGHATVFRRKGDSGGEIDMHFCPTCGSTIFWKICSMPEFIIVAIGGFQDPKSFDTPVFSVYEDRMHSWVKLPDGIEHMN